ncbi:MAG TPA: hypothetical protein VFT47_07300, partial [Vicinamibacterales bacterium]|nr:hypothetical protein [Vicinamibacterales bacterium]
MASIIPLLWFAFGTGLVLALAFALTPSRAAAIESRLEELTLSRDEEQKPRFQSLIALFKRLGERAPKSPKEMGTLRLR